MTGEKQDEDAGTVTAEGTNQDEQEEEKVISIKTKLDRVW